MNLSPFSFAFPLLALSLAAVACSESDPDPSPDDGGSGGAGGAGTGGADGTGGIVDGREDDVLVDDFEDGDDQTEFDGGWYIYLDDVNGGASTVTTPEWSRPGWLCRLQLVLYGLHARPRRPHLQSLRGHQRWRPGDSRGRGV